VGKSTVARKLGQRLGLPYLDTGKMYRAFGLHCRGKGADLKSPAAVISLLKGFTLPDLADPALLAESAGEAASLVSQIPEVRERMVALQRAEGRRAGCVVEGRDATTKIFPGAAHKFFLFADERVRIRRRWLQVGGDWAAVARQVTERDVRDRTRKASPLALAPDAVPVDTTALGVDEVVDLMARLCGQGGQDE
jgi:CMP/dCMP kinase